MYGFFPTELPAFRQAKTDEEIIEFVIELVVRDDGKFKQYCQTRLVNEIYQYILALSSLDPKDVDKAKIEEIFNTFIVVGSSMPLNLDAEQSQTLISAYRDFKANQLPAIEMVKRLQEAQTIIILSLIPNIITSDVSSRHRQKLIESVAGNGNTKNLGSEPDSGRDHCCSSNCCMS